MKVFISFDSKDSQLAYTLRGILREKDIEGYLFDLDQKYDSTLHDKITTAINDSNALVAIITKEMNSPSVHEEIGYAIASKKSVIIMLEEDAADGVLSHEREKEFFTKKDFEISCKRIRPYLEKLSEKMISSTKESSENFIQERNLLDIKSNNFGINLNSEKLENRSLYLSEIGKPIILFSTVPINLLEDVSVNSKDFETWLEKFRHIKIENLALMFHKGFKKIGLDIITYFYENPRKFTRYLEFNSKGFVEQGFTDTLVYPYLGTEFPNTPLLHSCWLTGSFWAFLLFCKQYYKHIGYDGEFDIFLSIRNSNNLMLMGFGGITANNGKWIEPWDIDWDSSPPKTDKDNKLCFPIPLYTTSIKTNTV